ncbi:diaminohydroxyphosphoribosylaminopyrimidine deaminase/5-amino-6-(5-phosphoribosylamino)uracil reductase [Cricetibacter osteomyelitidis]|uniref:Riboflavin biosynthesis protein RibD n=1 Tax=Cricetibacter osteomyelitidis TaxID=1521931 RepID=A0A4R2T2X4_9PAST|nr:bifunctional diaminohydroxyphosphoribosylaminopyrimidine deaminase/5-amino-6-(5-phosphoribosylamino)uracil reductase RibD [Cricetibacter osteomyelitidis]TCP95771.1 diaminohydroxyphosphoribosylaminopyrimidine deaminase/5-amino-6-(5-phosphoribosylamino)uracil reductase [Cricetibacter osteomyelitidis]
MPTQFTSQDKQFMQMALDLAVRGQFTTTPNPNVGCILVKNGEVIGQGYHHKAGEPHAEVMALRDAEQRGNDVQGATAYVTLEPCSHFGRTPPCALGLINAKVGKVIASMTDPNPQVAGCGLKMLSEAGIESAVGLLQEKAEAINKGFLKRMRTGLPFVRLKLAMSLDGRTAMASGESKWITGTEARADVQAERAKASAILSTSATVLADDPGLNIRWQQLPEKVRSVYPENSVRQPVRVILDRQHKVPFSAQIFQIPSPVWLVSNSARNEKFTKNLPHLTEILLPENMQNPLLSLMRELGQRQIDTLWVEAGATFAGALIEADLIDELILYIAPKLLGSDARGLCHLPHLTRLVDAPQWKLHSMTQIGQDVKLVYSREYKETE